MGLPNGRTLRDDRGRRRTAEHAHDRRRDGVRFRQRRRTALSGWRYGRVPMEKDLLQVYGIAVEEEAAQITYGRSNSPLIVDDLVIIPAGGPKDGRHVSLAAFDKRQGTLVWEAGDQQVSYSSPALVTLAGKRQILIVNEATVSGHDPKTGRVLWNIPWPAHTGSRPNVSQAMLVVSGPNLAVQRLRSWRGALCGSIQKRTERSP